MRDAQFIQLIKQNIHWINKSLYKENYSDIMKFNPNTNQYSKQNLVEELGDAKVAPLEDFLTLNNHKSRLFP